MVVSGPTPGSCVLTRIKGEAEELEKGTTVRGLDGETVKPEEKYKGQYHGFPSPTKGWGVCNAPEYSVPHARGL